MAKAAQGISGVALADMKAARNEFGRQLSCNIGSRWAGEGPRGPRGPPWAQEGAQNSGALEGLTRGRGEFPDGALPPFGRKTVVSVRTVACF